MGDEIYRGLAGDYPSDLFDPYYNDTGGKAKRRYTRTLTIMVDPELFEVYANLAGSEDLPFQGNQQALGRHLIALGIESLKGYLRGHKRQVWEALRDEYADLTHQGYREQIADIIAAHTNRMAFYTANREWPGVLQELEKAEDRIAAIPDPLWQRYMAREWATNAELRGLRARWKETMRHDSLSTWIRVQAVLTRFLEVAQLDAGE